MDQHWKPAGRHCSDPTSYTDTHTHVGPSCLSTAVYNNLQSGTHQVQAVFHMVVWLSMVSMNAVALCRTQLILEGSPSVVG